MIVVGLDSTTRTGSLAIARDGTIIGVRAGDPTRTHGERLPGDIVSLLDEHGLTLGDVDLYGIASGPGSFTGLRVGIATIQGLALVRQRLVVPVSALEALAATARPAAGGRLVAAWLDGQRREVFAALYAVGLDERFARTYDQTTGLCEIESPTVGRAVEVLSAWRELLEGRTVSFVGEGARMYRDEIEASCAGAEIADEVRLLAVPIVGIAIHRHAAGRAVSPHAVVPVYVRRSDAELARERGSSVG